MDGGRVTAPNWPSGPTTAGSSRTKACRPDIEVEQWPADVIAGKDPQLEKAIEIVLSDWPRTRPSDPETTEVSDPGDEVIEE